MCVRAHVRAWRRPVCAGAQPVTGSPPAGAEDCARVLRPPAATPLVGEGALGFRVRGLPGALRQGEARVQAGGGPPVSRTCWRREWTTALCPAPAPAAELPVGAPLGLVPRTGLAAFGPRTLSCCVSLAPPGWWGGGGGHWCLLEKLRLLLDVLMISGQARPFWAWQGWAAPCALRPAPSGSFLRCPRALN